MNVRPTSTPSSSPSDAAALRRTTPLATPKEGRESVPEGDSWSDAVELSADALALVAGSATARTSEMSPERLKSVLERMTSGFYDLPDVRDRILERLSFDLE